MIHISVFFRLLLNQITCWNVDKQEPTDQLGSPNTSRVFNFLVRFLISGDARQPGLLDDTIVGTLLDGAQPPSSCFAILELLWTSVAKKVEED